MSFKNNNEFRRMQRLIDACAKHGAAYFSAQAKLNELCKDKYGAEPGDVDADQIIDAVFGGCGTPSGMSAEDFDAIMLEATEDPDHA